MREIYGLFVAVTAGMSGIVKWQFPAIPVILLALFLLGSQAAFASDNETSIFNGSENFTTGNPLTVELLPEENNSTAPLAQNETSSDEPSTDNTTDLTENANTTTPVDGSPTDSNETSTNSTEDVSSVDNSTSGDDTFEIPDTGFTIPAPTENATETNSNDTETEIEENFTIPDPVVIEMPSNGTETNETDSNETEIDKTGPTYHSFGTTNETPTVGDLIEFHTLWKDDFGLDKWIFSWNGTGTWTNSTNSFISSYDEKTEIRVVGGWKKMRDLTYEDRIATLNGDRIEWEHPIRLLRLPHNGEVFKINGAINSVVTSDHKVYARIDNDASFAVRKVTDPLVGISTESFKFIRVDDAYDMLNNGNHLTFLGENLNPVYVSSIVKESYTGYIYDITVPNHIILVRRDGVPIWSSNLNIKEKWSIEPKIIENAGTIGYKFYAVDLFGNWNNTPVKTITSTSNSTFTAPQNFIQNVSFNMAPTETDESISDQNYFMLDDDSFEINLAEFFTDGDGDQLYYSAAFKEGESSDISWIVTGDTLSINTTYGAEGFYIFEINATDTFNTVTSLIEIDVEKREQKVPSGTYVSNLVIPNDVNFNELYNFTFDIPKSDDFKFIIVKEIPIMPLIENRRIDNGDHWTMEYQMNASICGQNSFWVQPFVYDNTDNRRLYEDLNLSVNVICDYEFLTQNADVFSERVEGLIVTHRKFVTGDVFSGQSVSWRKVITVNDKFAEKQGDIEIDLRVPETSFNLLSNDPTPIETKPSGGFGIASTSTKKTIDFDAKPDANKINVKNRLEVTYNTPGPTQTETVQSFGNSWKKIVNVNSEEHVTDVIVSTDIPSDIAPNIEFENPKETFSTDESPKFRIKTSGMGLKVYSQETVEAPSGPFGAFGTSQETTSQKEITTNEKNEVETSDENSDGKEDKLTWKSGLSNKTFTIEAEPIENLIDVRVEDANNKTTGINGKIINLGNGEFDIELDKPRSFRGGEFKLVVSAGAYEEEYWFDWGLITVNTKKSIYRTGETAEFLMVVLNKYGYLVEGADVTLEVTGPTNTKNIFSTSAGTITSEQLGIYKASMDVLHEGTYEMYVETKAAFTDANLTSYFLVDNDFEFDIVREVPVTIYPVEGPFNSSIEVTSYEDETFTFKELVPKDFTISDTGGASLEINGDTKILTWSNISNTTKVTYEFNTPEVWPYMYMMGQAEVDYSNGTFQEARPWYLAIDPPANWFNFTWQFRWEINVTENTGSELTEYQILLKDVNTSRAVNEFGGQSDCGDFRFTNATGHLIPHSILPATRGLKEGQIKQLGGCNAFDTQIWIQTDRLTASETSTFYFYFGALSVQENTENLEDVFNYTQNESIYYPIGSVNAGTFDNSDAAIVGFIDGTEVEFGPIYNEIIDRGETDLILNSELDSEETPVNVTRPVSINSDGASSNGGDIFVPVGFGGVNFTYGFTRSNNYLYFCALWGASEVNIYNDLGFQQQLFIADQGCNNTHDQGFNDPDDCTGGGVTACETATSVLINATNPVLGFHQASSNGGPPVPSNFEDDHWAMVPEQVSTYIIPTRILEAAGREANTQINVFWSDGSSQVTQFVGAFEKLNINCQNSALCPDVTGNSTWCAPGDRGLDACVPAGFVKTNDKPSGTLQTADRDGTDQTVGFPLEFLSSEYFVPQDSEYITWAYSTPATNCTLYSPNGTTMASDHSEPFDADWLLTQYVDWFVYGEDTAGLVQDGSRLSCNATVYAFIESDGSGAEDEQNLVGLEAGGKKTFPEPNFTVFQEIPETQNVTVQFENIFVENGTGGDLVGWSQGINISVEYIDFGNNSGNLTLWYSNESLPVLQAVGGPFYNLDFKFADDPSEPLHNETFNNVTFGCFEVSSQPYFFKVNVTNEFNHTAESEIVNSFTIEEDDTEVTLTAGDNIVMNRSDAQPDNTVELITYVTDTDNHSSVLAGALGQLSVSRDGGGSYETYAATTNATGHLLKDTESGFFNATCPTFEVGDQPWFTEILVSDVCYKPDTSPTFNLTIIGDLSNTITNPTNDEQFVSGSTITFTGTIADDCTAAVTNTSSGTPTNVTYYIVREDNTEYICTANYDGSNWVCDFDTTGQSDANFNVTMNSTKIYHNPDETSVDFNLISLPEIGNETINTTSITWNNSITFTIDVSDAPNDFVNVSFWLKKGSAEFILVENQSCQSCVSDTLSFDVLFNRTDIDSWQYKFNSTDQNGNLNVEPDPSGSFSVDKKTLVWINVTGNETISNRSESQTTELAIGIADAEDNRPLPLENLTFSVTIDGSIYSPAENATTVGGNASINFDATCSPKHAVGVQSWKAVVIDGTNYFTNPDSSTDIATQTNIRGDQIPDINKPDGTSNFTQEQAISFIGSVIDDCGDPLTTTVQYTFNYTDGGPLDFQCSPVTQIGSNAYTCDHPTLITTPSTFYNVTMNASTTNHYDNSTANTNEEGLFFLFPIRKLENLNAVPSSGLFTVENWNLSVNVSSGNDEEMDIELYLKKGGGGFVQCLPPTCINQTVPKCNNCIGTTMYWYRNFTVDDVGTWFYRFRMVNNATEGIETQTDGFETFEVQDLPSSPFFVEMENFIRNPTEAGWGFNSTFNVSIRSDAVNNVSVLLWRSEDGATDFQLVENNSLNFTDTESLQINVTFDAQPDDTSPSAGWKQWFFKFNATDGNTSTLLTNTTSLLTLNITKDNIIYDLFIGNNTIANREGSQTSPYSVRVRDSNGTLIPDLGVTFYVTTDGNLFDPGSVVTTDGAGVANYDFDPTCSPKHQAEHQNWKVELLNDPFYFDNSTNSTAGIPLNLTVFGDQVPDMNKPDNTNNFTQEQVISFLGSVIDDCGDPSTSTVQYTFNYTDVTPQSFQCTGINQVGANAFTCDYTTTITTPSDFYNVTMNVDRLYHYNNTTANTAEEGLFFLFPIRKLENLNAVPSSALFNVENWNFSVNVSSGNDEEMDIQLFMQKGSGGFTQCLPPTCINQTVPKCDNCIGTVMYWYRNFTVDDVGTWFYRFRMVNNATEFVEKQTDGFETFEVQDLPSSPFFVEMENFIRNPTEAGWGFNSTFNVSIRSDAVNNVSVLLWRSEDGSSNFQLVENVSLNFSDADPVQVNVTFDAQPDDTSSSAGWKQWFFKFNASDGNSSTLLTNTTTALTLNITKDNIIYDLIVGNNTIANREGSQTSPYSIRARDSNGTLIPDLGLTFYVTTDGNLFDPGSVVNTDGSGVASYAFDPTCSPKHQAGHQNWKVELLGDPAYFDNSTNDTAGIPLNLTIFGDQIPVMNKPDNTNNFTQEQVISFLGSVIDDCGDPLTSTVNYTFNYTDGSPQNFQCTGVTQVGANAFTCDFTTTITTPSEFYNVTMNVDKLYHYNNTTANTAEEGLFFIFPIRKLENLNAVPASGLFNVENWNFSVNVSSGNDEEMDIQLFMQKGSTGFVQCLPPTCINQTVPKCNNCIGTTMYWYRNFTVDDVGTWFYRFRMVNNVTEFVEKQTDGFETFEVQDLPSSLFFVEMENFQRNPTEAGWGFNSTFNVSIRSDAINNVSVVLWRSEDGATDFQQVQNISLNFTDTEPLQVNVTFDPQPDDTSPSAGWKQWFFKFNATDGNASTTLTNTTTLLTLNITKDNIIYDLIVGNNTIANREGSQTSPFSVRVRDSNGTLIPDLGVTFYVTTDGNLFDPGSVVTTDGSGVANYAFNPTCSPKHQAGHQNWKVELLGDAAYFDNSTNSTAGIPLNLTIFGDQIPVMNKPDGTNNFTQEQVISFLGSVIDDCGDPLTSTVNYTFNYTDGTPQDFQCTGIEQVGANAYTCDYTTTITTPAEFYNVTMNVDKLYHYNNTTANTKEEGLFLISPIRKLENLNAVPSSALFTVENWNFSVNVSSGNDEEMDIELYMQKGSGGFVQCLPPVCINQTVPKCNNCIGTVMYWYRNFTVNDVSTWFYRFRMVNNATEVVEKQTEGTETFEVQDLPVSPFVITADNFQRSPSEAGWGFNFTFNMTVETDQNNNVSAMLWRSENGLTNFQLIENVTLNFTNNPTQVNVTYDPQPDDTDAAAGWKQWFFKFNVTDHNGTLETTNTTSLLTLNITKDRVLFDAFFGNNSVANRRGNQTNHLYVRATDENGTVIPDLSLTMFVTLDSNLYDPGTVNTTNGTGVANFHFDPTCSPKHLVENQLWKVELATNDAYFANSTNTTGTYLNLSVFGNQLMTFVLPDGATNFTQENVINFLGAIDDDCADPLTSSVQYFMNYTNQSTLNAEALECAPVSVVGANAFTCDFTTTVYTPATFYNVTMITEEPGHYRNVTVNSTDPGFFFVNPLRRFENVEVTPLTEGWGVDNWNMSVNATSGNNDTMEIQIWLKKGSGGFAQCPETTCINQTPVNCDNCIGQTYTWYRNFTADDQDTWFVQFRMINNITTDTVTLTGGTDSFSVVKDDIVITESSGDGQIHDRGFEATYVSHLFDVDNGGNLSNPNATVTLNFTTDGDNFLSVTSNTTNSTGYVDHYFTPSCAFNVGPQNWTALTNNDPNYNDNVSSNSSATIFGFLQPANLTDTNINTYNDSAQSNDFALGDNITIRVGVNGDCGTIFDLSGTLNVSYEIFVNDTFPTGGDRFCNDVFYNSTEQTIGCEFNSSSLTNESYSIRMNASNVQYYNDGTQTSFNDFVIGIPPNQKPVLSDGAVTPTSSGWGDVYNFTVNVTDTDLFQNVTVYLWESPTGSEPFTLYGNQTCDFGCTGGNVETLWFQIDEYSCQQQGVRTFKFNASDNSTSPNRHSNEEIDTVTLGKDIVSFGSPEGAGGTTNRSADQLINLTVLVTDTTKGVPVESNLTAGRFFITTDGTNFNNVSSDINSNATSYLQYTFNATCLYEARGDHEWRVGVDVSDACYAAGNSTDYGLTILGDLLGVNITAVNSTNGFVIFNPNNATFEGDIIDDCGLYINDATSTFHATHSTGSPIVNGVPNPANNELNGSYNASVNMTTTAGGNYSVTLNSTRSSHNPGLDTIQNIIHHQIDPALVNPSVSPTQSSWGATYTFSVTSTDNDDIQNVSVYTRCIGGNTSVNGCEAGSNFTLLTSQTCDDCVNQVVNFPVVFNLQSQVGWYEAFINSSDQWGGNNQTDTFEFNVTQRPIIINLSQGDGNNITRIGTNVTQLEIQLIDGFTSSPLNGRSINFHVTFDEGNGLFAAPVSNTTAGGGVSTYYFNPTPDNIIPGTPCVGQVFIPGQQVWNATFTETSGYFGNSSSNFTVNVNTTLFNNINAPDGEVYSISEIITLSINVTDECGTGVTSADVRNRIFPGDLSCSAEPATDQSNGTYTCTFDTTSEGVGFYNITTNSSKNYYEFNRTTKIDAFELRRAPVFADEQIFPTTEGWGYNYTINLTVQDTDLGDVVNVSLYKSVNTAEWEFLGYQECNGCTSNTELEFYPQFHCSDYLSGPAIDFKWNATDTFGLPVESANVSATFQQDNVSFLVNFGDGATINREGNDQETFVVTVRDADRNFVPVNRTEEPDNVILSRFFFSTTDAPTFDSGHNVSLNSSGIASFTFNPDCNYEVGTQFWFHEINGNSCYVDTQQDNQGQTFINLGQLKIGLYEPTESSTFDVQDQIAHIFNVSSDCIVQEGNITGVLNSVNLYNYNNVSSNSTPILENPSPLTGNYNFSWDSTGEPEGDWTVGITSSLANYNSNSSNFTDWFFLNNQPPVVENDSIVPIPAGWGSVFNFSIYVTDPENNDVTCKLYTNTTGPWVERTSNSSTTPASCTVFYDQFTPADITNGTFGNGSWMFQINDTFNVFNTSVFNTLNITRNTVEVLLSFGDDSSVNRSDANPIGNDTVFIVLVNDTTRNEIVGAGERVDFYVTIDNTFYTWYGTNTTNSTGNALNLFNPNQTFNVGTQNWIAGTVDNAAYFDANSTNYQVEVYGDLVPNIESPIDPTNLTDGRYQRYTNITIVGNITDDRGDNIDFASVDFTSINVDQGQFNGGLQFLHNETVNVGGGKYNVTFNTSDPALMPSRFYDINFTAQAPFYNLNVSLFSNSYFIETKPLLQAPVIVQPASGSGGWGEEWIFRVNASDEDLDQMTVRIYVNESAGGAYALKATNTSVPGGLNTTVTFTISSPAFSGSLADSNRNFTINVTETTIDFAENINETVDVEFYIEQDDVNITHELGNLSSINRTDGSAFVFLQALLNDTDRNFQPNSRELDFYTDRNISQTNNFTILGTALTGPPQSNGCSKIHT